MSIQYQRLLKGKLYQPDETIQELKKHGRRLSREFNLTTEFETKKRETILRELLGKTGKQLTIKPSFYCSHGKHIEVGENFFCNFNCIFLDLNKIIIGNNVMIGPRVSIYTASHPIDAFVRKTGLEYALPVIIEDDVWIGGDAVINPGITIGKKSVIGSGSVVTKDIPSQVIAAGNPCKVIRNITDEDSHNWKQQLQEFEKECY